jgi:hypothetical protein
MKDMGLCPCPRCLTPKSLFGSLGLSEDMKRRINNLRVYVIATVARAREYIYNEGNTVDGAKVDRTLGDGSWVPTIVSASDSLWLVIDSNKLLAESICREAWPAWPRPIPHACR